MRDSVDLMAAIADLMERDGSYDALAMAARYRKQVAYARRLSPKTNGVNRSVQARLDALIADVRRWRSGGLW
jgi:hypothetical protein